MHPWRRHALALALAAACIPCPARAAGDADLPVVRIGLSAPLTSAPMGSLGPDTRDAAQLAIEELNAQGVRIGKSGVKLELVAMDDHADPVAAPAVARELAAAHVVGVVGPMNSGAALKAASTYAQAGLPMITPSATHPGLTRLGLPNVFRLQPDDAVLAQRLVAWVARERRLRRVDIVTEASSYGQVMSVLYRSAAQQAGLQAVEVPLEREPDFGVVVRRLDMDHPDAVLVAGLDGTGAALARALRERNVALALVGPDGMCSPQFARLAGSVRRGAVLCARQGLHAPDPGAALAAFDDRFARRFGHAPNVDDRYAPYAYESVRVLVAAMQDAGSSDPAAYASHIRGVTLRDSLVGPFHFDARGDVPDGTIALFTYDDDQRVWLSPLP
jgi:branched-chain amino acid transport system substrate-binding protein